MNKKIKQIKVGGVVYDLKDADLNILVNSLLNETLSTDNQQNPDEKYWVPTTTDKTQWDNIKVLKLFNLKGSVASFADLPATATTGDVYLIANSTTGFTEEWVKTDTSWEMLGTVANNGNFVKQVSDLVGYNGVNGEIVQYVGTDTQQYKNAYFYKKTQQTITGDAYQFQGGYYQYDETTNDTIFKSSSDALCQRLFFTSYDESAENVYTPYIGSEIAFVVGSIEVGNKVYYISNNGGVIHITSDTITAVRNDDDYVYIKLTQKGDEEFEVSTTPTPTYYQYSDDGNKWLLVGDGSAYKTWVEVTGNKRIIKGDTTSLSGTHTSEISQWNQINVQPSADISGKEDKSQVKDLFDGFTATLISGTTDEYLLTIPQCDSGGSIINS